MSSVLSYGNVSRVEHQMVDHITAHVLLGPYIVSKDQIVRNDSCDTRRRPDLLLSSSQDGPHIILECDEHQHQQGNYNEKCESGRMDELIDEFKTGRIIFVRWNPHSYNLPQGGSPVTRADRLTRLESLLISLVQPSSQPRDHIEVHYMYYDQDNPLVTTRFVTHFHY